MAWGHCLSSSLAAANIRLQAVSWPSSGVGLSYYDFDGIWRANFKKNFGLSCAGTRFCKDVPKEKFLLHFELCVWVCNVWLPWVIGHYEDIQTHEYFVSESHSTAHLRIECPSPCTDPLLTIINTYYTLYTILVAIVSFVDDSSNLPHVFAT